MYIFFSRLSAPRPIKSICRDVCGPSCVIQLFFCIKKSLITPIYKIPRSKLSFTKIFLREAFQKNTIESMTMVMKRKGSQNILFLRNSIKPRRKKVDMWVFLNHPAVHSGGLAVEGSVVVAVSISDIFRVKNLSLFFSRSISESQIVARQFHV